MDKINAAGIHLAQQATLARMQQLQTLAAGSALHGNQPVLPPDSAFSAAAPLSFSQALNGAINNVDALQHSASAKQQAIEMGQSDDLAGAMIESQKASVAFSAMMQVRNKLTSALDEVMNIPL